TIAIVGENGAGKSTLVKLLCGLYEPTSGRILADDVDLASVVAQEWRVKVAALFQDFARLQLSCGDAIGVGDLPRHDDAFALDDAVARAGSESVIDALPDRYATQLGRHFDGGVDLSGGGWQRVALAQAMMRRTPLVLVLDEPASALDAFAEHQLFLRYAAAARRPETLHSGAITVFVSHRFSTVRMADVIVVMSGGRIAEVGDHDDLMRRRGIYADLYSAQAAAYADSGAPEDRPTQLPPVG
ncbi:MAG: ATP-binding cassette, subfamily bacterial, partial [Acidimicrobiaceae bacterium]|nr:ATP-binding cassette, subfamily bacterial [Acidimicrobiaceae bacterium]